jgi:hypothetical protein
MFNAHLHKEIEELKKKNAGLLEKLGAREDAYRRAEALERDARQELKEFRNSLDKEKQKLEFDLKYAGDTAAIAMEKALQEQARKMSEVLIKSDIERERAKAALAVYEKMDTKADANTIKEMAVKLIEMVGVIGKPQVNVNTGAAK